MSKGLSTITVLDMALAAMLGTVCLGSSEHVKRIAQNTANQQFSHTSEDDSKSGSNMLDLSK